MVQKMPIGIQSFEKLRRGGFAYVDKTAQMYDMVTGVATTFCLVPAVLGRASF